jgi:hypothetical protein
MHGCNQHAVQQFDFVRILFVFRLDALGHEILGNDILQFVCVGFLVHDPPNQLVRAPVLFFDKYNLVHGFFDGGDMFTYQGYPHGIVVYSARYFAMGVRQP